MAFIGDDEESSGSEFSDVLKQMEQKAAAMAVVASERDRIIDANVGTPFKLMVGGVIWAWLMYHFLIKR